LGKALSAQTALIDCLLWQVTIGAGQYRVRISGRFERQEMKPASGRSTPQKLHRSHFHYHTEIAVGVKKTGKGRRKLGRKKRRMRSRIRHRKG
jgi:hypothetical protein